MKTQMKFQKILSLISLIAAALAIVLGLCFCSGVMSEIIPYLSDKYSINAGNLYEYSQSANNTLVILSIVLLLVVTTIYITASNTRRNYYITNYVSLGIVIAYTVVFAIILLVICVTAMGYANEIDFVKWKEFYEAHTTDRYGNVSYTNPRNYSESRLTLILGVVLAIVLLVEAAAWVLNLIWKIKLMQGEKALLANGVEVKQMEVA
ncbi:MAG: hypothetical protein ACI4QI_01415 [Candidatus Coproplasma sp.]